MNKINKRSSIKPPSFLSGDDGSTSSFEKKKSTKRSIAFDKHVDVVDSTRKHSVLYIEEPEVELPVNILK